MTNDPAEAEPLKLKLRMLQAERDRLSADFEYVRDRLAAIDDEMKRLRKRLQRMAQPRIKRIK